MYRLKVTSTEKQFIREWVKDTYFSDVFTQLVLVGVACSLRKLL